MRAKKLAAYLSAILIVSMPLYASAATNYSTDLERGSGQYWSITDASQSGLDITGNMTISLWARLESAPSTDQIYSLVAKYKGSTSQESYYFLYENAAGTPRLRFVTTSTGSNDADVTANVTLNTSQWHHIAVVYSTSTPSATIYVDGISQTTSGTPRSSIFDSSSDFTIGIDGDHSSSRAFDGLIEDVRIWSKALNGSDISNLYSDPCNFSNGSNLMGWWKFDNDGTDSSGNNTLTNNNSSTFSSTVAYSCSTVFGGGPSLATTTVSFGKIGSPSHACFNTKNITGDDISFYFAGTSLIVEDNQCR